MAKISIVTRAYNVESYISQCVNSVLAQSFIDFEYIIINNGSTDGTAKILEELSKKDDRIRLINITKNDLNIGSLPTLIDKGTGEYFIQLDSDDWIEPDCLEKLYDCAITNDVQIAIGGQCQFLNEGNFESELVFYETTVVERKEYATYFPDFHVLFRPIWGKLFSAKLVKARWQSLTQSRPSYLNYGGDTYTCLELLRQTDKIAFVSKPLYHYRIHNKSISYKYYKERFFSDIFLYEHAKGFLTDFGWISETNLIFISRVFINAFIDTIQVILKCDITTEKKLYEILRVLNHPQTQQACKTSFHLERLESLRICLCNICFEIFRHNKNNGLIISRLRSLICCVNPNIKEYVTLSNISLLLKEQNFLLSVINEESIFKELKRNKLLSPLSETFVNQYFSLIFLVYRKKYKNALENAIDILNSNKSIKLELNLIELVLNIAAFLEDGSAFVYASKQLACFYLKEGNLEKSKDTIENLIEMVNYDSEVEQLINVYNQMIN